LAKQGLYETTTTSRAYLISKEGETLVFSVMVNHFTSPISEIRSGIGKVLSWLPA
jgi:hypothetical protein